MVARREITAAPPLRSELAIVLGVAAFGLLVGWAAPHVNAWIHEAPVHTSTPRQVELARQRAEHFGRVLTAGFNGKRLTDGSREIRCR
jgi:hypothetical protein